MASVIASVYSHCHTSEGLLTWDLDVLPSTIYNGRLTGVPLGLDELQISAPSDDLEWLSGGILPAEHWQLSSASIDLTPPLSVQSNEHRFGAWSDEVPTFTELTLRKGHRCQDSLRVPIQHDLARLGPTVFMCDETTTESEVNDAVMKGSILLSERTAHLHGYVGGLAEIEHLNTIVEAILNGDATHHHQRQENWRRRILRLHPGFVWLNQRTTGPIFDESTPFDTSCSCPKTR